MSVRKFCSIKVYSYNNSYILSSDAVKDEKLRISVCNSTICVNSLSTEEWNSMIESRTNSVSSPSYANIFSGYGCLGLLSTSIDQTMQPMQVFQQPVQAIQQQQSPQVKSDSAPMQYYLLFVKDAASVGTVRSFEVMRITDIFVLPLNNNNENNYNMYNQQVNYQSQSVDFVNEIRKLLCSNVFYFSVSNDPNLSFDLTLSSQARNLTFSTNKKFLWNYNLHIPLRRLNVDTNAWLLKIICGFVEIRKIHIHAKTYRVGIISRLSCERVGARFLCRGIDDHGNVANFVETEQVIYSTETDEEISFLQLRGSIPVFFEQTGLQVGSHKIRISRSVQACYPAFERHIQSLIQEYGSSVFALNLLGIKGDEEYLSHFYRDLCESSQFSMKSQLFYANYDYHSELKNNKLSLNYKLWPELMKTFYPKGFDEGMFFYSKSPQVNKTHSINDSGLESETFSCVKPQLKYVRTNCMDCLDRTNSVQSFIGKEMLRYQLKFITDSEIDIRKFSDVFGQMWISNGDNISRIYAGTGAIQGRSVTKDLTTSLSRAFQNNFLDDNKHDSIESFLFSMSRNYGTLTDRVSVLLSKTFLRLPYSVLREIVLCKNEYTEKEKCRVMIGTWNINGGFTENEMQQVNIKLNDWLMDGPINARKSGLGYLDPTLRDDMSSMGNIDIFAIGFEEIVDLNAQNIVNASEENATRWRIEINRYLKNYGEYVELISENLQLVGVCLFVFVLKKHVGGIRDVCVSKTKTGFGGTAGNKGGVLLRFNFYNTSMCFVCSHFAAHQKEIRQRNDDFRQIYEQSAFSGQKSNSKTKILTKNHDYIFWCGDLNYRIDLPNDKCRSLIAERNWEPLLEADQLNVQRREQNVFREFNEAPISFPPTYKYNVYEDTYDRSEKCRVPAWTDRILWRTRAYPKEKEPNPTRCLYYGRGDIRFSDHRPVSSLMEVEYCKVIPKRLIEVLNKVLLSFHGSFQVVLVVSTHNNQMNDNIKNDLIQLFNTIPTFATWREYKNNLYITYTDGKFGYEAFAQFNNYHLEAFDLTVQIRIENEQNYQKIIEEELLDCLSSLDYYKNNFRKMSINPDIKVTNLLVGDNSKNSDDSDDGSYVSYINVPSQLHSNISITSNMHNYKSFDTDSISLDSKHEYHNPIIKALSNSNLSSLNHPHTNTRIAHSDANLLDLSLDEPISLSVPPIRPPPPPPSVTNKQQQQQQEQPLIEIESQNKFGFDDDFNSLFINDTVQTQQVPQPRPPPLPPYPNRNPSVSSVEPSNQTQNNVTFSLFDDAFDRQVKTQTSVLVTQAPQQPPLPPRPVSLPNQVTNNNSTSISKPPPPLPPLPPVANRNPTTNSPGFTDNFANFQINSNMTNNKQPIIAQRSNIPPPLPPPPKLPPRIPATVQKNNTPNSLDTLLVDLSFGNKNLNSTSQPVQSANNVFDPFGDSFVVNDPLPPPRMNHFS